MEKQAGQYLDKVPWFIVSASHAIARSSLSDYRKTIVRKVF
jgi:hypothetical protein